MTASRLDPLPIEATPDLAEHFNFFVGTLGFIPNSVLTMQRKPKLVKALAALNGADMDPQGEVDLGFRRLIGHFSSKAAGCQYCMAHTVLGARNFGIDEAKMDAIWDYRTSSLYTEAERVALDFAVAASQVPNDALDFRQARSNPRFTSPAACSGTRHTIRTRTRGARASADVFRRVGRRAAPR